MSSVFDEPSHDEVLERLKNQKKLKRKRGRPSREDPGVMSNGYINENKLFSFVKKESLPKKELPRFLALCDLLITSLGPKTLSDSDIEEIALYYRDRIYADMIYEEFANSYDASIEGEPGGIDTSMLKQIESFNKALEKKKENLGARFIDKGKKRDELLKGKTLVDILAEFQETPENYDKLVRDHKKMLEEKNKEFTNTSEYMEKKLGVYDK